ncbi:related to putative protein [Rhynchosporium agropyri]|uniref:Guanine nucleotide-binding protein subunit gamma n=1 Tax=Rhynchosporium agropyri TaxID=914238 RepID=A0A1E1JW53_9HELO|nr:related to putative protein [Rhynchosporium agropyri]
MEEKRHCDYDLHSAQFPHIAVPVVSTAIQKAVVKSPYAESCQPPGTPSSNTIHSRQTRLARQLGVATVSNKDTLDMPSGYSSREDPGQIKKNKQSMADLKLRRLTELNTRLREDLERERIPVSAASKSIISYTNSTKDFMVPSVWGTVEKKDDPYAPQQSGGCCIVM